MAGLTSVLMLVNGMPMIYPIYEFDSGDEDADKVEAQLNGLAPP